MDFSRATELTIQAFASAESLARKMSHGSLTPLHILSGILAAREGLPAIALTQKGILENVQNSLQTALNALPTVSGGKLAADPTIQEILTKAEEEMTAMGDSFVSLEHIFFGILKVTSSAKDLLKEEGVTYAEFKTSITSLRGPHTVMDQNPENKVQALAKYTIDFTALAREGKLDPVIGRDD